jgi:hypothetical protein
MFIKPAEVMVFLPGADNLVPDAVHWPVLTRPPMAGFEVTTEGPATDGEDG